MNLLGLSSILCVGPLAPKKTDAPPPLEAAPSAPAPIASAPTEATVKKRPGRRRVGRASLRVAQRTSQGAGATGLNI